MLSENIDLSIQQLPCPLSAGWELVNQYELPQKDPNGFDIGGFSALNYQQKTDHLYLLSDDPKGYFLSFSGLNKLIKNPRKKSELNYEYKVNLKNKDGSRLFNLDPEGLAIQGSTAFIVDEAKTLKPEIFRLSKQANIYAFDLNTGLLKEKINLPNNWNILLRFKGINTGPEALTNGPNNSLFVATETPLIQKFRSPKEEVWGMTLVPLAMKSKESNKAKTIANIAVLGSVKDILTTKKGSHLLAWSRINSWPNNYKYSMQIYPLNLTIGKSKSIQPLEISNPLPTSNKNWEGISFGPINKDRIQSLIVINDNNDESFYSKNLLSILMPKNKGNCHAKSNL